MMRFNTTRFGELEVDNDRLITFPDGIPGFPDVKRYILMDYRDTSLKWLQSVDDPDIAFIVAEPKIFSPDYSVKLDDTVRQYLQIKNDMDIAILVIVRVENGNIVPNLHGPLLLNAENMRGVQIVVEKIS